MTPPQVPPVDPGNQLLSEVPALLTTAIVNTTQGQRLAATIRTASTTLTVLLQGKDGRSWGQQLVKTSESMSVAGLVIANGHLP